MSGGFDDWLLRVGEQAAGLDQGMGSAAIVQSQLADDLLMPRVVYFGNESLPAFVSAFHAAMPPAMRDLFARAMITSGSFLNILDALGPAATSAFAGLTRAYGVRDILGITAQDGEGWYISLAHLAPRRVEVDKTSLSCWVRVASHLGAALRLRRRIEERQQQPVAVLSPAGRILDAQGLGPGARSELGAAVQRVERARGALRRSRPEESLSLWEALLRGRYTLVDRIDCDGRRFVLAYANEIERAEPGALTAREAAVVRWVVGGAANKEIAYGLGITESTVAWHLMRAIGKLGLRNRVELIALWRAAQGRGAGFPQDAVALLPLSAEPQGDSLAALTLAERQVVLLAASGLSDREIAAQRGCASDTVSNLLRQAFRKLGVQSRAGLARTLARPPQRGRPP